MRPNFFIVGAPKCGTTSWVEYLSSHPNIRFARVKEPHYFNTDFENFRWVRTEADYLALFEGYASERIVAEASVQYLYSSDAARNIAEFNPEARILIMLRQPSSFIRSYHNQLLLNYDETIKDLKTAWNLSGDRKGASLPPENREPALLNYKKVGLFSEQVERYLTHFKRSQVMIVFFEDWIRDPRTLYLELLDFLELEDDGRIEFPRVHQAKQFSNRTLHKLTQRPPTSLKRISRTIRYIPGLHNFNPVSVLRRINTHEGYSTAAEDTDLAYEIDTFFGEDQDRLQRTLTTPQ